MHLYRLRKPRDTSKQRDEMSKMKGNKVENDWYEKEECSNTSERTKKHTIDSPGQERHRRHLQRGPQEQPPE